MQQRDSVWIHQPSVLQLKEIMTPHKMRKLSQQLSGYLYVLYNDIYKSYGANVYKLGRTVNLKNRMGNYTTPFINASEYLYVSRKFEDSVKAERVLFYILRVYRIKDKREFFDLTLESIKKTFDRLSNLNDNTIDRLYSLIVTGICSQRVIENLESDEEFYDKIIRDANRMDEYFNQFKFRPQNPEFYKKWGYIPEEEKSLEIMLIKVGEDNLEYKMEELSIN